jgi:hypothetical protein
MKNEQEIQTKLVLMCYKLFVLRNVFLRIIFLSFGLVNTTKLTSKKKGTVSVPLTKN